mmetsp:Transcript_50074/g.93708  ORF Transcript_50074/g.93708 Transcript_50074/m.93708 type:complete len:217 (+) Transcript_50074:62-712(+)
MSPEVRAKRAPASGQSSQRTRFRAQFYKTELCQFYSDGLCSRGPSCNYAHGENELRIPPDLAKTSMCKDWQAGHCKLHPSKCQFAHGSDELKRTEVYSRKKAAREVLVDFHPNPRTRRAERIKQPLEDKRDEPVKRAEKNAFNQVPMSLKNEVDSGTFTKSQEDLSSSLKADDDMLLLPLWKALAENPQSTQLSTKVSPSMLEKVLTDAMPDYYED